MLLQKTKHAKQRRGHEPSTIAIPNIGRMDVRLN